MPGDKIVHASMAGWIHLFVELVELVGFVEFVVFVGFIVFIELNQLLAAILDCGLRICCIALLYHFTLN